LIRSAYRTLLKQKRLYRTEQAILKFLRKLPDIENNTNRANNFNALKTELRYLKRVPLEKNAFEYFDFSEWAELHTS
jgi:5-methylcytosine-specific restriction endonuclease McrBC regulatory subunit McrC